MVLTRPKHVTAKKRIKVLVAPAAYPVTVEQVYEHLRIDPTDVTAEEQAYIEGLIDAATDEVESYLRKALITRTLQQTMDTFFSGGVMPIWEGMIQASRSAFSTKEEGLLWPPLQTVDEIRTYDINNNSSVYSSSNYSVDNSSPNQYGRVYLNSSASSPSSLRQTAAVEYEYKAGYGDSAETIPYGIRQGILQLIGYMYENRGDCSGNTAGEDGPLKASGAETFLKKFRIERLDP